MQAIRYFYKPIEPVDPLTVQGEIEGEDFSWTLHDHEKVEIENIWNCLKEEKGDSLFSRPRSLGSLHETTAQLLTYKPTDFKTYLGVVRSYSSQSLRSRTYEDMRVSSVGATVRFIDGSVFVHRRSRHVTHAKNMIDSSVAGFCPVTCEGIFEFIPALQEKLKRELKVRLEDIVNILLSAVHNSTSPDFSGMCSYVVDTSLDKDSIIDKIDKSYMDEWYVIPPQQLPDFIVEHYAVLGDMCGDGCAVLLSSLQHATFNETIDRLTKKGKIIEFGQLKKGSFLREEKNESGS